MYNSGTSTYKSRGEQRIADFLQDSNIEFQYEYPLAIKDRGQVRIWYPDFRLSEYNTIIEYFGIKGNPAYDEQMAHKIETYKQAGIDGIYLLESSFSGGWQQWILDRIEQNLERKMHKINTCRSGNLEAKSEI